MGADLDHLGQHDLDVVGPHPSGHHRERHAAERPGRGGDLAVAPLQGHRVEPRSDLRHAAWIADQQHVLRELAPLESDVVLPRAGAWGIRARELGHDGWHSSFRARSGEVGAEYTLARRVLEGSPAEAQVRGSPPSRPVTVQAGAGSRPLAGAVAKVSPPARRSASVRSRPNAPVRQASMPTSTTSARAVSRRTDAYLDCAERAAIGSIKLAPLAPIGSLLDDPLPSAEPMPFARSPAVIPGACAVSPPFAEVDAPPDPDAASSTSPPRSGSAAWPLAPDAAFTSRITPDPIAPPPVPAADEVAART